MGSEVKHTKTSDFGGEKGFLQGHAKKWVFCTLKCPEVRKGFQFQQDIFESQVRETGSQSG